MGRKCSVRNCSSDSTKPEHTGVTFHKVPHHSDVRPKWLSLCQIPEEKNSTKLLFVCSRHFLRADFCSFKGTKYMLRQGVLPSVFPWDKSRLEAIKAEVNSKRDCDLPKIKDKKKLIPKMEVDQSPSEQENNTENQSKVESVNIKQESEKTSISKKTEVNELEELDAFDQHQRSQDTSLSNPISFTINSRIEVLDNNNKWYPAKINEVDYEENEVLIHFEKFSNKYDEWISMSSPRLRPLLRPLQLNTFERYEVGERCMAIWSDSRKFPATVTKILDNDSYEVLFDDHFVKVLKNSKISKLNPTKPSPLFEPVKGTKQERRDKKRKLNVAALFRKRVRTADHVKKNKITSETVDFPKELPVTQEETRNQDSSPEQFHILWKDSEPIGEDSTIEIDGISNKTVIVNDPRLPTGWIKHLYRKLTTSSTSKWNVIIVSPEGVQFKSKAEMKTYSEQHPELKINLNMFDFNVARNNQKKKQTKLKIKHNLDSPVAVERAPLKLKNKHNSDSQVAEVPVEHIPPEDFGVKEELIEEPPVSLKIIFENDAHKCPIEGCGKSFRRENLALMHVKHYHSEFTKYLDSTPNVADLAYARTVGENLDRSPVSTKSNNKAALERTPGVTKTPKDSATTQTEMMSEIYPMTDQKSKDNEIIKLLTKKADNVSSDMPPLPSGLPTSMYPDIKLEDILDKNDEVHMRDDIHIKHLCASRPSHGIKTLLPIRTNNELPSADNVEEKSTPKRKRAASESKELQKGKNSHHSISDHQQHQLEQPPSSQTPIQHSQHPNEVFNKNNQQSISELDPTYSSVPPAFDLTPFTGLDLARPSPVAQFDGVIIEGGKIIKIERMKQEEIINCTCGFMEEDGLMIQCELCLCWQHAYCNNIQKESEVPEKYICFICLHPLRERRSTRYLHDQEWLKQGTLPVASYHSKSEDLSTRFEKLKKLNDLSGGMLELKDYLNTFAMKLKISEEKNHPKLYLWSEPWEKLDLPENSGLNNQDTFENKPKLTNVNRHGNKNEMEISKNFNSGDSMLMMMLKSGKEDIPMLNVQNNMAPLIPQPEAAIDSNDCRLNLLEHIAHAESLIEERLDNFEKQLNMLEQGIDLESDPDYPKTRQTLQLLIRDLETLTKFTDLSFV